MYLKFPARRRYGLIELLRSVDAYVRKISLSLFSVLGCVGIIQVTSVKLSPSARYILLGVGVRGDGGEASGGQGPQQAASAR